MRADVNFHLVILVPEISDFLCIVLLLHSCQHVCVKITNHSVGNY